MREGEPRFYSSALRVAWREIGERLDERPAYATHSSPSPIFDPEVGVTTDHDSGVW